MLRRNLGAVVGLALATVAPLSAQVIGLPVVNSGVPVGIQIAADVGFANAAYGKGTTVGASAGVGIGYFGVGAQIARYSPKFGDAITAAGVNASMRLLGGPLVPFRIMAMAGYSGWSMKSGDILTKYQHIPLSIALAATIPAPGLGIKPWVAPRLDLMHSTGNTDSRFGISGGIDFSLANGMTIRGAYDRVTISGGNPSILSVGLGFALK
jgi:hypothetical protein